MDNHNFDPAVREHFPYIVRAPHSNICNLERFSSDSIVKSVVFSAAEQVSPPFILLPNPLESELLVSNAFSVYAGPVEDLGFYFCQNVGVRGRGLLVKDSYRIYAPDIIPDYVESEILKSARTELLDGGTRKEILFNGTYVHLMSEAYPIYGHWLVDIIPKAWLYMTQFGKRFVEAKFLFANDTPKFGLEILERLFSIQAHQISFYDIEAEIPIVERMVVPSLMHNSHVYHPAMLRAIAYVREIMGINSFKIEDRQGVMDKIYVSRRNFRNKSISTRRQIANEEELIEIAISKGFEIIYPEELSWDDQVRSFARAKIIVGEAGSGLHNTMFSPPGACTIAMCQGSQVQGTLAALLNQTVMILGPSRTEDLNGTMNFYIEAERFELALSSALNSKSLN
jgi:capsular polysaccharide biosynthesis protein